MNHGGPLVPPYFQEASGTLKRGKTITANGSPEFEKMGRRNPLFQSWRESSEGSFFLRQRLVVGWHNLFLERQVNPTARFHGLEHPTHDLDRTGPVVAGDERLFVAHQTAHKMFAHPLIIVRRPGWYDRYPPLLQGTMDLQSDSITTLLFY